jgi:methyl-accepting chemotaxis protein
MSLPICSQRRMDDFANLSRRGVQVSSTNLSRSANLLPSLAPTSNQAARGTIRGSGIQTKILGIVVVLAAVALLATGIGVSTVRSYHDQVAAMTQASAHALLGEQIDKLVTAVVMDSRGIHMSADKDEAEKFAPGLLKSLTALQQRTAEWLAIATAAEREKFAEAANKVEEFVRFRTELVRITRNVNLQEARSYGDNDANRSNRSQLNKTLSSLVKKSSLRISQLSGDLEDFYRDRLLQLMGLCLVGVAAGIALAIVVIRRSIVKPLTVYLGGVQRCRGNLETEVPGLSRGDEIGVLAGALSNFKEKLLAQRKQDSELVELRASSEKEAATTLLEMCETLEWDVESTVVDVLQHSQEEVKIGERAVADGRAIANEALAVASAAEQASQNVTSISAATEELSTTGREIARSAVKSADASQKAVAEVDQAGTTISALSASAEQIGVVVSLISEVAAQTNLLALNATIEAARVGAAGRGFAVVATEVKALARKSSDAAIDIGERVKQICSATGQSVDALNKIGAGVREINQVSAGMAAAAEEQEATLQEVARSLSEASSGVNSVASSVAGISSHASQVEAQNRAVSTMITNTDRRVSNLRANLIVSLRLSAAGDRRSVEHRIPVKLSGTLKCGGSVLQGVIIDISSGGSLFRADDSDAAVAERGTVVIDIEKIGNIESSVIAKSASGIHLQFANMSDEARQHLASFIRSVAEADQKFISAAKNASAQIAQVFEVAVAKGHVSNDALFDSNYRKIPNTNPVQHLTDFMELCDRVLPAVQEPMLDLDPRVVFCAAVDRNGYLATHNHKYSQKQRPDEPVWNTANCRNRRIFSDRAGLSAARTSREYLLQTYDREMGDGVVVTLKQIDVPIKVQGRHWGAVRAAFRA